MAEAGGVGLIGRGTIGTGVARVLASNADVIEERLGFPLRLVRVADLDTERDRGVDLGGARFDSDAEGLIVADPQATGDYWNTPNSLPRYWDVPDVPFVDEVINDIDREFGVDRSRLYVAGFSNGTIFTEGLACTRGDRCAAVAMVGASMSLEISQNCPSSQPIPAMFFFATQIRSFFGRMDSPPHRACWEGRAVTSGGP